ncbi:MAG: hypothetical protein ACRDTF_25500 [Pseudonocardiaceae bacterium]
MKDADRELLAMLGQAGARFGEIAVGLLEDSLTRDEQITFGHQLVDLAERFRQRALRTAGMVVEGDLT